MRTLTQWLTGLLLVLAGIAGAEAAGTLTPRGTTASPAPR
jgi:hypothetical protein